MSRNRRLYSKLAFFMVGFLAGYHQISVADQYDLKAVLAGAERTIWSRPHRPFLCVGSLEQLRQHFHLVKPFLPKMPFKMENKWVIPSADGTFRMSAVNGGFSPNGDYVVQIEPRRDVFEFPPNSRRIRLLTSEGKLLWEKEWGPTSALVTDDGRVIGDNIAGHQPLALVIYDRKVRRSSLGFLYFKAATNSPMEAGCV